MCVLRMNAIQSLRWRIVSESRKIDDEDEKEEQDEEKVHGEATARERSPFPRAPMNILLGALTGSGVSGFIACG